MTKSSRVGSRSADQLAGRVRGIDTGAWARVDADALPPEQRAMFVRRRSAIKLYLDGALDADIRREAGMSRSNVYRLIVERCLLPHSDGDLYGWRGALPYLRVAGYHRKTKPRAGENGAGSAGSLQWLFDSPEGRDLEQRLRKQILGKAEGLAGPGRLKQPLFRWLIGELRDLGYERRGEWPFTVEKLGYVTIATYIDRVLAENPARQRLLLGGEEARRKAIAGDGTGRPTWSRSIASNAMPTSWTCAWSWLCRHRTAGTKCARSTGCGSSCCWTWRAGWCWVITSACAGSARPRTC